MEEQEEKPRICPKCDSAMEKIEYESVVIDRCVSCRGLWFDNLEHEKLKLLEGSEAVDMGNRGVGKRYDKVGKIECPVCHAPMVRMVDAKQRHIWYESCAVCSGLFFDAGEFADFKKENWLDHLKDWIRRRRPY